MELEVVNKQGQPTGRTIELPDDIFGIEPNEHVMYLAVKQYLAGLRSGTHKTLEVSDISGSTRKLHKQKGTGGSRKGSIKSPLFRGGATIFGPRPRKYNFKLNKKVVALSKRSALSVKAQNNSIKVIEDFDIETPKTKTYLQFLNDLGVNNQKSLLITPDLDLNVYLSSRNIPNTDVLEVMSFNAYDLLNTNVVLISEKSIEKITDLLSTEKA